MHPHRIEPATLSEAVGRSVTAPTVSVRHYLFTEKLSIFQLFISVHGKYFILVSYVLQKMLILPLHFFSKIQADNF